MGNHLGLPALALAGLAAYLLYEYKTRGTGPPLTYVRHNAGYDYNPNIPVRRRDSDSNNWDTWTSNNNGLSLQAPSSFKGEEMVYPGSNYNIPYGLDEYPYGGRLGFINPDPWYGGCGNSLCDPMMDYDWNVWY
jgi:hypothetical protein